MKKYEDIVVERVSELMSDFRNKYYDHCKFDPVDPEIKFELKSCSIAGMCSFYYEDGYGDLNFNSIIMEDNWDNFDQTIIHEVAHYCVALLYGCIYKNGRRVIHGKEWKSMMIFLGGEIKRCHNYNVSRAVKNSRTQKKWEYKCDCSTHWVSTTLHNKIRYKGQQRICRSCKSRIKYVG